MSMDYYACSGYLLELTKDRFEQFELDRCIDLMKVFKKDVKGWLNEGSVDEAYVIDALIDQGYVQFPQDASDDERDNIYDDISIDGFPEQLIWELLSAKEKFNVAIAIFSLELDQQTITLTLGDETIHAELFYFSPESGGRYDDLESNTLYLTFDEDRLYERKPTAAGLILEEQKNFPDYCSWTGFG